MQTGIIQHSFPNDGFKKPGENYNEMIFQNRLMEMVKTKYLKVSLNNICSIVLILGVFKRLVGIDIPYNLLGYNSLYSFMDTIPDVAMIERFVYMF